MFAEYMQQIDVLLASETPLPNLDLAGLQELKKTLEAHTHTNYFEGKESRYGFTEAEARVNSALREQ